VCARPGTPRSGGDDLALNCQQQPLGLGQAQPYVLQLLVVLGHDDELVDGHLLVVIGDDHELKLEA
jgi:hypothetical protein